MYQALSLSAGYGITQRHCPSLQMNQNGHTAPRPGADNPNGVTSARPLQSSLVFSTLPPAHTPVPQRSIPFFSWVLIEPLV